MNRKIISEILTGYWCINRQWADAHLPLVIALLKGSNVVSFVDRTGDEGIEQPFAIDPKTMLRYNLYLYRAPNPNIPPGSVGIIPFTGPLTYYNGDCGEPGMIQRLNWLMDLQRRDNIVAIVQLVDTPGGISTAATHYIAQMAKIDKPILTYVDHCCASLGMWFAAQSDEVYVSNDLAEMGSIGTYCMLIDAKGALEAEGYKVIEVYAPQSTDKNKWYRDVLAGDDTLIKQDLAIHVDAFIGHVSKSNNTTRSPRAKGNVKEWGSGKMFYGPDAVKFGLADGIRNFQQVVSKASWLAKRKN